MIRSSLGVVGRSLTISLKKCPAKIHANFAFSSVVKESSPPLWHGGLRHSTLQARTVRSLGVHGFQDASATSPIRMPAKKVRRSNLNRIIRAIIIISAIYVGFNLEFAPFTHRLRLIAIPVPVELLISKRLLNQSFPENLVITGAAKEVTTNLINVLVQEAEKDFLNDIRPNGNITTYPWNLTIIEHPMVNAYCAPAGSIVVYSGLIDFCVEAEKQRKINSASAAICGVLSHEISHGVLRHGIETLSWMPILLIVMLFAQAFFISLGFGMEEVRLLNTIFEDIVQFFLRLPHSRKVESEADLLGAELLERSGLPINDYPKILSLLQTGEAEWFSTHPAPERRSTAIKKHILDTQDKIRELDDRLASLLDEADRTYAKFSTRPTRAEPTMSRLLS